MLEGWTWRVHTAPYDERWLASEGVKCYAAPGVNVAQTKSVFDFILRLAFFAAAPFLLVFVAALFPVTGAVVQIALALAVFFAGEAVRNLAARSKIARIVLRPQLAFEAHYREFQPRPFLYYVFYPFLFPYWLWVPEARREFLLFKGYTLASFVMLVVSLVLQFEQAFPPELTLRDFVPIAAGTFAAETLVILMFLMPIVTSVVHFHTTHARYRLAALLVVGIVSIGFAAARLERRRDPIVSYATRARVRLRSDAKPAAAVTAQTNALHAAWKALPHEKDDVDSDGKVEGLPLETARTALMTFYKNDEAHAFDVWLTKQGKTALMVVYFEARRNHPPIWLAMDKAGKTVRDVKQLPRGAFVAMRHAAE